MSSKSNNLLIASILLLHLFCLSGSFAQSNETIYALNKGVTTKNVKQGEQIRWGQTKPFPNSSYVLIRKKPNGTFTSKLMLGESLPMAIILNIIQKWIMNTNMSEMMEEKLNIY